MRLLLTLSILTTFLNWWNTDTTLLISNTETSNFCVSDRQRDSLVLVALYNSTGGENWTYTQINIANTGNSWDFSQPINTWHGVEVGEDGCIIKLILEDNNLNGSIPIELGQLSNLTRLSLSSNTLSGSIPSELGQLSNLEVLQLPDNQLSGTIPIELVELSNLTWFSLHSNNLNGTIPIELGQLSNLTRLYLYDNELSGSIPVELRQLSNLTWLSLYENELNGSIPSELGQLSNLEVLQLFDNQLSGTIPVELGQLSKLTVFDIGFNNLNGTIPIELGELSNLIWLSLSSNALSGSIPSELGQFSNLEVLQLPDNQLSGTIPIELGELSNLTWFSLHSNNLNGTIPIELGELSNLTRLYLYDNELSGSIPVELRQLSNLTWLSLYENELNGSIPSELGQLSNLEVLQLFDNQLSGTIPVELGQLSKLTVFDIGFNNLNGTIPIELGQLSNLTWLSLHNNQLSGCFTNELLTLCNVTYNFSDNLALPWQGDFERYCNGEEQTGVPCDDGNPNTENDVINADCSCDTPIVTNDCRMLDSLVLVTLYNSTGGEDWTISWDLDMPMDTWFGLTLNEEGCVSRIVLPNTNLVGQLSDISGLLSLEEFRCNRNTLIGSIPNFRDLPSIRVFNFDSSQLTGEIPDFDTPSLEELYLGGNTLTGSIPDFTNLPNLRVLQCQGNALTGEIPNFNNLPNLEQFLCRANDLEGEIPDFSNCRNLTEFDCHRNNLTGGVPNFSNLPNLRIFNCDLNALTGAIPDFTNLSNLEELYLGGNDLTGSIPNFLNLPNLRILQCHLNDLTGSIPNFNFPNLESFWCYGNNLTGNIPDELGQLSNLTELLLHDNELSDCFSNELLTLCNINYNFSDNPALPWQGDFERYCNGEEQTAATCDDGNPNTENDVINADCSCGTPLINFSFAASDNEECGTSAFQIQLSGEGELPYTCTWQLLDTSTPVTTATFAENEWTTEVEQGGSYIIAIEDATGAVLHDTILVRDFPRPNTMPDYNECEATGFISANLADGTAGYWSGNGIVAPMSKETIVELEYGNNEFVWWLSKDECFDYASDTLIVFREGYPEATKDAYCLSIAQDTLALSLVNNDDVTACSDYTIRFSNLEIAARLTEAEKGVYHFEAQQSNEVLNFEYTVCNAICLDFCATESVYLEIIPTIENILSKAIALTPNGDGDNDTFFIKDLELNSYPRQELLILNQWEQVIYHADPYLNNWDGTYENGQPVTDGTYYYILRLGTVNDNRVGRIWVRRR